MILKARRFEIDIFCFFYNHEKYVADCLESILAQKTSAKIKIIAHDDCSTDGTLGILKEYSKKYSFIELIEQKKNKYSQIGAGAIKFLVEKSTAEYIALMDGDDYWVDENKIEEQLKLLLSNRNCKVCSTNTIIETKSVDDKNKKKAKLSKKDIYLDGGAISTSSIVLRREVLDDRLLKILNKSPVGDYFIQAYAYQLGDCILNYNEFATVYRLNEGSVSKRETIFTKNSLYTLYALSKFLTMKGNGNRILIMLRIFKFLINRTKQAFN